MYKKNHGKINFFNIKKKLFEEINVNYRESMPCSHRKHALNKTINYICHYLKWIALYSLYKKFTYTALIM